MKKSEMKIEAKKAILMKFRDVIYAKNQSYSSTYLDTLWCLCSELRGMLRAYHYVGLITLKQYMSLSSIVSNIDCYQDIFDHRKEEV